MLVQLEIAAADTDIWQAVDAPTPVEETVAARRWPSPTSNVVPELSAPGGRPAIGGTVSTAVGTDRLAAVDAYAQWEGTTRAEAMRRLLDLGLAVAVSLFDADMNRIGTPTAEQVEAANGTDGGWIWVDAEGTPFVAIDEKRDEETGEWVPLVERYGYRTDLTKVCVACAPGSP